MKDNRQEKIIELIRRRIIFTQEDLQKALLEEGFRVTQSTVSRDIKELRLVKGHDSAGNYRYVLPESALPTEQSAMHYRELFSRSVRSIDYALNSVVLKCDTGMASSACVSLDILYGDRMLGSLAGDDTVLIVMRSEESAAELAGELKKLI